MAEDSVPGCVVIIVDNQINQSRCILMLAKDGQGAQARGVPHCQVGVAGRRAIIVPPGEICMVAADDSTVAAADPVPERIDFRA